MSTIMLRAVCRCGAERCESSDRERECLRRLAEAGWQRKVESKHVERWWCPEHAKERDDEGED